MTVFLGRGNGQTISCPRKTGPQDITKKGLQRLLTRVNLTLMLGSFGTETNGDQPYISTVFSKLYI